ncbi:MAG: alkaline phosphatase family protein, partial [Spirochaetales bacterium]|nr:alkaline phosphatase family protein [Spirochaetales bacterium]
NYVRKVGLNTLLRRAGFIDVDENNKVTDYRAFVESNGMSAYVFLKDPDDKTVYNQVYDCLRKLSGENLWGFHEVLTRDEAKERFGLDGDFAFIVESDNYSYCGSYWTEPVIRDLEWKDYRYGHATHGYFPEKGPQPVFWCRGPSFRKGVVIEKGRVIDEAPTLAATFEGTLPEADGRALTEILNC